MARKRPNMLENRVDQVELDYGADAHSQHVERSHKAAASGLSFTVAQMVDVQDLHPSPYNGVFDDAKTAEYWDELRRDIEETGIVTDPLLAKRDGTLISGHSRLKIATELSEAGRAEFSKVPVRYVRNELSEEEEARRVYLSNLLRFDIPQDLRLLLEAKVYPDYFSSPKNGRPRQDDTQRNTSVSIAAQSGQSPDSVRKKRKIFSEAAKRAMERGADAPDVSDIAAARNALNNVRRNKAVPPPAARGTDRMKSRRKHITLMALRSFVSEFCEKSNNEEANELLNEFLRFVEGELS
jgi:hypothetical protein